MNFFNKNLNGILVCFVIAIPSWLLGKAFPVIGGPVIAILAGMLITLVWTNKGKAESGIKWTSKIILQTAVVLLGFGMNLGVILQTGKQSPSDHRMYDKYFSDHCVGSPQDHECPIEYFDSRRGRLIHLRRICDRCHCTGHRCR